VLLGAQVAWLSLKLNPDWLCAAAILLGTNLSSGLPSTLLVSASRTAQRASDVASPFLSGKLSSTSRYFTCSPSDLSEEVSDAEFFFAAKNGTGWNVIFNAAKYKKKPANHYDNRIFTKFFKKKK
jgi:hypothetical protein